MVGCVAVLTAVTTPAMAASIPLPQAAAELNAAIAATNAAPSYRYQETGSNGAQAAYNAAGQYEENHFSFGHQLVFEGVGNFHEIKWRSDAVRDTVRGYLNKPALQWEFVVGPNRYEYLEWADVPFNRYGRLDDLNTASLRVADKTTSGSETIYHVSFAGTQLVDVFTVDAAGRLARRALADQSGKLLDDSRETWDFVPVTLTQPSPDTVAPIRDVDEAIEAATLGTTIKRVARDAARTANRRALSPKKAQGVRAGQGVREELPWQRPCRGTLVPVPEDPAQGHPHLPREPLHRGAGLVAHRAARREVEGCADEGLRRPAQPLVRGIRP